MKYLFKYIILLVSLFYFINISYAQKKHKSSKKIKHKSTHVSKVKKQNINIQKNTIKITPIIKIDTVPEKTITIISDFKPQLKNISKIDFNYASFKDDTSRIHTTFNIPSQNLSFQYKPISLIPVSYKIDSLYKVKNNGSIQIGFGNYLQRDLMLNYHVLDAFQNMHSFQFYNNAYTGLHHLQSLNEMGFTYQNNLNLDNHNKIISNFYYKLSERYRYGVVPDNSTYPMSNYSQNYYLTGASFSLLNDLNNEKFVKYKPILNFEHFEGLTGTTNNWFELKNNLYFTYKKLNYHFDLNYNYNSLKNNSTNSTSNNFINFTPSIEFKNAYGNFKIGTSQIIENGKWNGYPLILFTKNLQDANYLLIAGWNTEIINNQYTTLVASNPWISVPNALKMTTLDKKFVEVKITEGNRTDYGFKLSLNNYKNLPLFNRTLTVNPIINGLFYNAIFEKEASTIELSGYMRYQFSDQLLIDNQLKYIQFNALLENSKPWGITPFQLESSLHWSPNKKWNVMGGIHFWTGATMYNSNNLAVTSKNAMMLNVQIQYKLSSNWSSWLKGENLVDQTYERWLDYPSLGMQLKGGVVYSFRK